MASAAKTAPASDVLHISDELDLPIDVAVEALAILGTRGSGKSHTGAVLAEELWRVGIQFVVLDPTGVFWGLRSTADGDGAGLPIYLLGGPHGDAPLEETAGVLLADLIVDTGQSFVLDLSDFPSKAAQTRFVTDLAERLYARKARARTPLHLILDEAEEFIPQDVRREGARMVGAWERVVGLGRSRGLGATLISRRAQAVNKKVLDLAETLLAMRTGAKLARDKIRDWIDSKEVEDELGIVESLKGLPTGRAWFWSPVRDLVVEAPVRRIRTFDSYQTPKPGEVRPEARVLAPIDVDELGAAIAATIERKRAEDPAWLQKRLADAERLARGQAVEIDHWEKWNESIRAAHGDTAVEEVLAVYMAARQDTGYSADLADEVRALADRPATATVEQITVSVLTEEDRLLLERVATSGAAIVDRVPALLAAIEAPPPPPPPPVPAPVRPSPPPSRPAAAPPRPRAPSAPARLHSVPQPPPDADGVKVSKSMQRILDALAWFEAIGVPAPRRPPLAGLAGVRASSGGFRANVSTLSGAGLVWYPEGGRVALTDAGRARADTSDVPHTEEALHDAICATVSAPQATILRELLRDWPRAIGRPELAERAGVVETSGGFRANVSTLSGMELIVYPERGTVAAAPLLFPQRRHDA